MRDLSCDLCVIGAGSAGLSVAAGTAQLGLNTVLIEAGRMGGDCLNTGCVPSKALLAAAKQAHAQAHGGIDGILSLTPHIEAAGVRRHVAETIAAIAPHDSQERFEGLGVTVLREHARFEDSSCLIAGDTRVTARNFVIATGSRPSLPPIQGLDPARVLTNETLFSLEAIPDHLVVIGGGPIGVEMAQAHRRLGARVTLLEMHSLLPRDEPELVAVVRKTLVAEGAEILENVEVRRIEHGEGASHRVIIALGAQERVLQASHILVTAGRQANVADLGLEAAGVELDGKGIKTDARLRTNRRHIFAIGDVAGGPRFTHVAGYHAGIVVRNIAFRLPAKTDYSALPWVTYTDPELAHVGLTEAEARARHGDAVKCPMQSFAGVDRAVAERRREGCLKLVAMPNGGILGCSIIGPGAGEMIGLWALAIRQKLKLRALTNTILPYPTFSEIARHAAGEWYKPALFSGRTRRLVDLLQKLPRL